MTVINDILDFSKIEAERMELENQPFDLMRCIEEAMDLVNPKAVEKGIEMGCKTEESLPRVFVGDVGRLRQIFVNLLSNAVKFTEKGEIVVSVVGRADATTIYTNCISPSATPASEFRWTGRIGCSSRSARSTPRRAGDSAEPASAWPSANDCAS